LRRPSEGVAEAGPAQADRVFLWTPVAFGCGAAGYMTWRTEPSLVALVSLLGASVLLAVFLGRRWPGTVLATAAMLLACAAAGGFAGSCRTRAVDAPIIQPATGPRLLEGWVVDVDSPGSSGPRLVVKPTWIAGVAPEALPHHVRIGVGEGGPLLGPGTGLRTRALLNAPPGPAAPGAYDFARDSYFRRIGGVGPALTPPELVSLRPPDRGTQLAIAVNSFRWSLARRIVQRMGPERGGVAVAMVTGHEAWVTPETLVAMRDSGLAHVLSISGLHMAIVGGFVFFAVRLGAAAWPWLALRVSTKSWPPRRAWWPCSGTWSCRERRRQPCGPP
jgi:competence protein ComEC